MSTPKFEGWRWESVAEAPDTVSLEEAAADILALVQESQEPVWLRYKGTPIHVTPGRTVAEIVREWKDQNGGSYGLDLSKMLREAYGRR